MKTRLLSLVLFCTVSIQLSAQKSKAPKKDDFEKEVSAFFHIKEDRFDSQKKQWYKPKIAAVSHNTNSVYCYFAMVDGVPSNFRLVINRCSKSGWLLFKSFKFNIDGEVFELTPHHDETESDLDINYYWEWCDMGISAGEVEVIEAMAIGDKVEIKYEGSKYFDTRKIPSDERYYVRKTLEYYYKLGGSF